ncbi:hypothetical protein EC991_007332 [Linnemannia zychae]|nr:hypothetical protein EC991_007332 [Linnemannia zychae]
MPHHHSKQINAYLSDAVITNRKNVARACDRCRSRKTACDGQRPICSRCYRDNVECTYFTPSHKRGPKVKKTGLATDPPLASDDLTAVSRSSGNDMPISKDPFSKEVTDHLVALFFNTCFFEYNFISPIDFLREYTAGTLNPDILYAVCAISARLSDHPAVFKSPPSSNGQVYVARIRSRMPHLISQVSLETAHILSLTAEAEYTAGNLAQGHRIDGVGQQMIIELQLHQLQRPVNFESESERIAFEIKCNTLNCFVCNETFISIISGLPGVFLNIPINLPVPSNDPAWWMERIAVTGRPMDPVDNYTLSILHSILKPRRLKGYGLCRPLFQLMEIGKSIWRYGNAGSEQDKPGVDHAETDTLGYDSGSSFTSMSAAGDSQPQDMMDASRQLEAELEQWRATVPEEWEPSRGRYSVSWTNKNVIFSAIHYYIFSIILYRPLLIKACLSIVNGESGQGGSSSGPGGGTDSGRSSQHIYSEFTTDQQGESLQAVQVYLTKCVLAADEILAMVGQFTDEEVKLWGPLYAFPMFIAGTVYVIQQFVDKTSNLTGEVKSKLTACQRFLLTLGPYWKGASDQALLLKRLSLSGSDGGSDDSESREAHGMSLSSLSSPMESLVEFMVSTPPMFENETEDSTIGHISHTGEEQEGSSTAYSQSDLQVDISLERRLDTPGKEKEGKAEAKGAMNVFMTTDTGVGTLWGRPEKMAELEEATLLSLEKLSMVEDHVSKKSY